jgi:cell division initiation protein
MKMSPLDIKKQEFATKFRGYSQDEVHAFLEMAAEEYEQVLKRNLDLEQKVALLEDRLENYKRMEAVLQETLITTQRTAEETRANAEKRAQTIIAEAKIDAQRVAYGTNERLSRVRREIADLQAQRDSFRISLRSLLESQMSLLNLVEKKDEAQKEATPPQRKVDLTDEELEKIVSDFEKRIGLDDKVAGPPQAGKE